MSIESAWLLVRQPACSEGESVSEAYEVEDACTRYLSYVADARRDVDRVEAKRAEMRENIDMLGAIRYDKVGHARGEHGDDRIAAVVCQLEAIDASLVERMGAYAEAMAEWLRVTSDMDKLEVAVLERYYVVGKYDNTVTWEAVARELGYSERSMYYVRMNALYDLYERLPDGWR